jgi:YidC/Oxa1 family membrane protein insertase
MDRNKLIGLILISAILILYTHFWGPKPIPISSQEQSSLATQAMPSGSLKPFVQDIAQQPGTFAQPMQDNVGQEVMLENKDIKVTLTSQGGTIKEVVLKNYLDHQGQPLVLLDAQSNQMGFQFTTNQVEMNTSQLHFETADKHQYVSGEEVGKATFTLTLGPDQYIRQVFSLPSQGYELTQYWDIVGLESSIDQGAIGFVWHDLIKRAEKDLQACRSKSTINYYLADNSFQHLKERSDKQEVKTVEKPIKWVGIKQRFFTTGIVADEAFTKGRLALNPTLQSDSTVKEAQVWLSLPAAKDQKNRQGKFLFYFGPNDYKILKHVTPGFSKNLPLGWPVVKWINQFLILPIFSFLEQYISNYGIIILLLVVLIKLLLLPLSYKSYISMAEMKVLKPTLDKIKGQYGNDLQKMQMEQAKLYREMGINPLSGCIPVFLQMPILLAMFNFFPNAIELRQKAFLWAHDLSTYDAIIQLPFNIPAYGSHVSLFTLLMTASTILYTWSNNQVTAPEGPMKAMSYLLPLTFMFVLNSFPAGLSFYYFVSNLITFGQQALIKKFVDEEKIKEKLINHKQKIVGGKKGDFKARLQKAIRGTSQNK